MTWQPLLTRVGRAFVFFDIEQEGEKGLVAAWRWDYPREVRREREMPFRDDFRCGVAYRPTPIDTLTRFTVEGFDAKGFVMVKPDWWEAQPRDLGLAARTPPLPTPRGEIG